MILDFVGDMFIEGFIEFWPWKRRVPDVRGQNLEACRLAIEAKELELRVRADASPEALVTAQQPDPRTRVKAGCPVFVTVEEA